MKDSKCTVCLCEIDATDSAGVGECCRKVPLGVRAQLSTLRHRLSETHSIIDNLRAKARYLERELSAIKREEREREEQENCQSKELNKLRTENTYLELNVKSLVDRQLKLTRQIDRLRGENTVGLCKLCEMEKKVYPVEGHYICKSCHDEIKEMANRVDSPVGE